MTQADSVHSTPPTNAPIPQTQSDAPSRRRFLTQAAGVAAGGAVLGMALPLPVSAEDSQRVPDPILAAIETHKAAMSAVVAVLDTHTILEKELPKEKRRSFVTIWEEKIVETDDPRWIECEREIIRAWDAEMDAAVTLVTVRPTTQAGLLALLQHALMHDTDGCAWPAELVSDDGKRRTWHYFLIENVATALALGVA